MIYKFLFITCLSFLLLSCIERERSNPFDPENDKEILDRGLRATGYLDYIRLGWYETTNLDFDSTVIYRASGSNQYFTIRKVLPVGQTYFNDFVPAIDQKYSYYLKLIGDNTESSPTHIVSATPGPGEIWILDQWNFEALNLSYDLQRIKRSNYGVWIPRDLCFAYNKDQALITYPAYNYFEIFQISEPYNRILGSDEIKRPYDCIYDLLTNRFWITDSSGSLYRVNSESEQVVNIYDEFTRPTKIVPYRTNTVFVIDEGQKQIHQFNTTGSHVGPLEEVGAIRLNNPQWIDVDNRNGFVYIIDRTESGDVVIKYNPQENTARILFEGSQIRGISVNQNNQSIWIINRIDLNSVIMQLSGDGVRLTELEDYGNPIDVQVNPYNGNIIIIDAADAVVWHIRSDQSIVGSYNESRQPIKVLIE